MTSSFASPTLAGFTQIDGSTDNNGHFGWGSRLAITPDGAYIFLNGYLQRSTGGDFTTFTDPSGNDPWACPGSHVSCSDNTVAFRSSTDGANTIVAYIIIP